MSCAYNTKILINSEVERKAVNPVTNISDSKCPVYFFPLATSADRFYRIDRSQVSSFQIIEESEMSPS